MRPRDLITLTAGAAIAVLGFAVLQNGAVTATTTSTPTATQQSAGSTQTVAVNGESEPGEFGDDEGGTTQVTQPTRTNTGGTTKSTTGSVPATKKTTGGYTMAQVSQHNTSSSCWTTINGNVYNLTAWIDQHPGGSGPILSLCGTDGSAAFNAQHGGQGRPEAELANFYLGPLAS